MVKCKKCDKDFTSEEGLAHHNKAKHREPRAEKKISPAKKKKIKNWSIFLISLGLIILGIYALTSNVSSCKDLPAKELTLASHTNVISHIHPLLSIYIDEERQGIPANIGVETEFMRALHTHDSSGKLHIESPCPGRTQFPLGDFFEIWEEDFYKEGMSVKMTVNGKENIDLDNYILKDLDNIKLEYTTNEN
jgi:hypothetical protein